MRWLRLLVPCVYISSLSLHSQNDASIFKQIPTEHSNISFENNIHETVYFNYYTFMHIYMGGGVAAGDFNNDDLVDIYFTSNLGENKLYLNQGEMKFEDVTGTAKVQGNGGFHTGVTTVDINNDGFLDLYVCRSGPETESYLPNLLYINNGDLTFEESAMRYGLSESNSQSIQANFFDYDNDGDLDVYIVNTPVDFELTNAIIDTQTIYQDPSFLKYGGADKLYRNNGDETFSDVSAPAGIKADIFFGLNVLVGDINNDGWKDIFVSNDFNGPDFCYINNQNGTFSEKAKDVFSHISFYSMGSDMADVNNDGLLDIFILDMLPEDYVRSKTSMTMMPREVMANMIKSGYHRQYMHNMLQLNNGNTSNLRPLFREIGQFAQVAKTDWSWSSLFADFNLDGYNDLHVTNGILRDVTNVDAKIDQRKYFLELKESNSLNLSQEILRTTRSLYPSVKLNNYLFLNNGDLTFTKMEEIENTGPTSFSNGAAVADFDNDGDLDLVCNNVNDKAFLFENKCKTPNTHFLKIRLSGPNHNKLGIGSRIKIWYNDKHQIKEVSTTRGYFSASEVTVHFGVGNARKIERLQVIWPNSLMQEIKNVVVDRTITLYYEDAKPEYDWSNETLKPSNTKFVSSNHILSQPYRHFDISYDDYRHQILLPHKLSATGPKIVTGDLNNDSLIDFFISGASWFSGAIYLQDETGRFFLSQQPDLAEDKKCEDVGGLIFDANQDGFQDLLVVSGSFEFPQGSDLLQDRLYLNDKKGQMVKAENALPDLSFNGSCAVALDFDLDGDQDLFIGGRVEQGKYPYPARSFLLQNVEGQFRNVTQQIAPWLSNVGMVTDAIASDFDKDGDEDLILVGEWMPITILKNEAGQFTNATSKMGLDQTSGWWQTIIEADINRDSYPDFIAGNLGLNYKFHASKEKPLHLFGNDFDQTGTIDIVLAKNIDNELFPVRGKMCSSEQMPFINDKFPTFTEFANANLYNIYGTSLNEALHLEAHEFRSSIILNKRNGNLEVIPLPMEAQLSTVNGIVCEDINSDDIPDILLAGNMYDSEVETSRGDAGCGTVLLGLGNQSFQVMPHQSSGFFIPGNIKDLQIVQTNKGLVILAAENNAPLKVFSNYPSE